MDKWIEILQELNEEFQADNDAAFAKFQQEEQQQKEQNHDIQ
jgi:hypothetical protein